MVVRSTVLLAVMGLALLAGCLDDDSTQSAGSFDGISAGQAPTGSGAGSSSTHGARTTTESPVTISRQGSDYIAKKTFTYDNDFGGAANADVKLKTVSGGVEFADWNSGGYQIVASLQARASSEQAARDNLARLKVVQSDRLSGDRLTIDAEVQFPAGVNQLSGSLLARLPASPAYRLTGTTISGGAAAHGLGGPSISLTTTSGGVSAVGAFNTANLQTSSGGIALDGTFNLVKAETTSGGIEGRVRSTASGSLTLATTSGGVSLRLLGASTNGYDVTGDASSGGVSLSIGQSEPVGSQSPNHKHVRTVGYAEAPIRVVVDASTGSGGVSVTR